MDFFERQEQARRKTKWLVFYFLLCVVLTVAAVYAVFVLIFLKPYQHQGPIPLEAIWNPNLFLYVTGGTLAVIIIGSLTKISELSAGGSAVATSLGGRPLDPHTRDLDEQKLRNVVEEMAIASGVPVPQIYILDDEQGINAFAAGNSPNDAAIGVTRGAIEILNRDELQGVIGHEFSHILNGDMRLNLRLMGWIFGILCLTVVGRILLRTSSSSRHHRRSSSNKKGGNPLPLIGLFLILIGGIGVFFGKLIKAAVSRQREFLADAAAVQFTRNPGGLAGALKKIGGLAFGSRLETPKAEEASHMFFGNGLKASWFNVFATHPPLEERIRLLDPAFAGDFSEVSVRESRVSEHEPAVPPVIGHRREAHSAAVSGLVGSGRVAPSISADTAMSQIGAPTSAHLHYVEDVVASLPPRLAAAIREPFSATAMVYALLLNEEQAPRWKQLNGLPGAAKDETVKLFSDINSLGKNVKLSLVELALPALRQLSRAQYDQFSKNVKSLVIADEEIDLFEYALQKVLLRHLEPQFNPVRKSPVQYYVLRGLKDECSLLLSALAHAGHDSEAEIARAFSAGTGRLASANIDLHFIELKECTLDKLDAALDRLAQSAPICKKQLLEACAQTVSADGVLQSAEGELLRAISDSLDCPMPPLVG